MQENEAEIVQDEAEIAQDEAVEMEATEAEPTVEDLIKENETLKVLQQNYLGEIEDLRRENDLLKQSEQSCQDKIEELKRENERLICFDDQLKVKLEAHTLNEENFRNDDKKVLFYTGLSTWELLLTLFTYVQPNLSCTAKSSLSPFQQLLLTLMRLRLNMSNQDLGYRYQIHQSTAFNLCEWFTYIMTVTFITCTMGCHLSNGNPMIIIWSFHQYFPHPSSQKITVTFQTLIIHEILTSVWTWCY